MFIKGQLRYTRLEASMVKRKLTSARLLVRDQVDDQMWRQLRSQVDDQVRNQVGIQVLRRASSQVKAQVEAKLRGKHG